MIERVITRIAITARAISTMAITATAVTVRTITGRTAVIIIALGMVTGLPNFPRAPLAAQTVPVGIELQAGTARPLGRFEDMGARSSLFTSVELLVELHPRFAAYGGFRWADYECAETPCPALSSRQSLEETGWVVGLEAGFAPRGILTPRLRAGVTLHRLSAGEGPSAPELGMEIGGGMEVALGRGLAVTPRLRYHRWSSDPVTGFGSTTARLPVSQVSLTIGVLLRPYQPEDQPEDQPEETLREGSSHR